MIRHRSGYTWFIIIIILAVSLRIGAAIYLGNTLVGVQQQRIHDQVSYDALAQSILAGKGYTFNHYWYPFTPAGVPTAHWSFLYPLYLAGIYTVVGYYPLIARLIQAVICGLLSIWLFYRLGRRLFGETAGLLAAFLGAVYIYFIYHEAALMTEPFFNLGVLASLELALILAGVRHPSQEDEPDHITVTSLTRTWLALGLVLGLTALLRQTILLWLPFMYLWILVVRRPRVSIIKPLLSISVVVLLILPWTVRNYLVYHAFLPLNSNAGYALYSANHPYHGTHFDQDYGAPLPEDLIGKGYNEAQWNSALTLRGLQFIFEDPHRYLLLSLSRVPIFFNFWFSSESNLSSNIMRVLSFGLYLPFFIYGLILSRKNWRPASLIYLFVIIFSLLHILTWASIRYRLPIDAALIPFAALAIMDIADRFRLRFNLPVKGSISHLLSTDLHK